MDIPFADFRLANIECQQQENTYVAYCSIWTLGVVKLIINIWSFCFVCRHDCGVFVVHYMRSEWTDLFTKVMPVSLFHQCLWQFNVVMCCYWFIWYMLWISRITQILDHQLDRSWFVGWHYTDVMTKTLGIQYILRAIQCGGRVRGYVEMASKLGQLVRAIHVWVKGRLHPLEESNSVTPFATLISLCT